MYHLAIQQFVRTLNNLDAILGKAQAYAETRKFDVNNFVQARLAPDMLPFSTQIQIACDAAKAAASNLSGKEAPKHEDNEKTIAELRERIGKCRQFLESLRAEDFQKTTPKTKVLASPRHNKWMLADDFLWGRQVPNFFFHVTTAYAILRAGGVDIGKSDYLGQLPTLDP
jgi:hypothetical protein